MELIYGKLTDTEIVQEGVLTEFSLDYDVAGEKDFELTVSSKTASKGFNFWFVRDTEYGGIIEKKKIDSENGETVFSGRNTRGLLDSRVIYTASAPTVDFEGNFKERFDRYITKWFPGLFTIDNTDVEIPYQTIASGTTLYEAMETVCNQFDLHLSFEYDAYGKAHITLETAHDYSDEITYTSANTHNFTFETGYTECTTFIAYCSSNNKKHTMYFYTDENGGVQPYATADIPMCDLDYIVDGDDTYKVVTGYKEKVKAENFNCQPKYNYVLLHDAPKGWNALFDAYYTYDAEKDEYIEVEGVVGEKYSILSSQPDDWKTSYDSYYTKNSEGEYQAAKGTSKSSYTLLTNKPKDWAVNFSSYYRRKTDGTSYSWYAVPSATSTVYKKQTTRPSKWESSFGSYYQATKSGKKWTYTQVKGIGKTKSPPTWIKGKYYTKTTIKSTPSFKLGEVYYQSKTVDVAPTFVANTYYKRTETISAPAWDSNSFYKRYVDNYASLVSQALESLKNYIVCQSITFTLYKPEVNVGDIVGCSDLETNTNAIGTVTNIVYKVNGANEEYQYEIGDLKMAAYNFERPFSDKYTFTDGETKLIAEMFDNLKAELKETQDNLWQAVYPVGSIYISTVNTNPGSLFGGTWEAYGRGRTLVSAEIEGYKSVGGYKFGSDSLQSHSHTIAAHTHTAATAAAGAHSHKNTLHYEQIGVAKGSDYYIRVPNANGNKTNTDGMVTESSVSNHTHTMTIGSKALTTNTYGTGGSNNYQPSIIVFIFRRVA